MQNRITVQLAAQKISEFLTFCVVIFIIFFFSSSSSSTSSSTSSANVHWNKKQTKDEVDCSGGESERGTNSSVGIWATERKRKGEGEGEIRRTYRNFGHASRWHKKVLLLLLLLSLKTWRYEDVRCGGGGGGGGAISRNCIPCWRFWRGGRFFYFPFVFPFVGGLVPLDVQSLTISSGRWKYFGWVVVKEFCCSSKYVLLLMARTLCSALLCSALWSSVFCGQYFFRFSSRRQSM